jgi:hypothetical protein
LNYDGSELDFKLFFELCNELQVRFSLLGLI